jgi:beta-galactosidase GanA
LCWLAGGLLSVGAYAGEKTDPLLPHLERQGTATRLIVDGHPFLVRGAELNNSSASSLDYMKPLWPKLAATHLNTVLATVSWELIEPQEGKFEFGLVDGLIQEARANNLHLVFLWFGSWKNGKSTYQPLWVKTNQERFPLARSKDGKSVPVLSTLSGANRDADARAFAALMRHLRETDGGKHTVLMIQVENEVGILGDSRDHSSAADTAFAGPAPKELLDYLQAHKDTLIPQLRQRWETAGFKTSGTWEEVFGAGDATDEMFMAWNYARYIGRVAAAGKGEYALPMYVNAWLRQPDYPKPGDYPSGGPLPQVMDVWRAGARDIDILSPDIYATNFTEWCQWFAQSGNPLFIPESRGDARGAANGIWAFGAQDAMGYSPFGIDRMAGADTELARAYDVIAQVSPMILASQGRNLMTAVLLDRDQTQTVRLGNYNIEARFSARSFGPATNTSPDRVAGLFIAEGPDDFLVVGRSMNVYFTVATDPAQKVGLGTVEEGVYREGRWIPGRRLNGDETPEWRALRFRGDAYTIQRVKLYRYQ